MRNYLILLLMISLMGISSIAQELGMTDTISVHTDNLSLILKSDNYRAKADLLKNFRSPVFMGQLKSATEELKLDSIVVSEWSDELQRIEKSKLYTCIFEDEGRTVLVDIMIWDAEKSKWIKGSHNYYWFSADDQLEQTEFQEYVTPQYRYYIRINYEYENGLIKYETKYDRIDEIEEWDEVEQLEYTYSDDSLLKMVDVNEWDSNAKKWIANAYRLYNYDSLKMLNKVVGYDYDHYEDISKKKFELAYDYDSLGNMIKVVEFIPGWGEELFVPERKQENTYGLTSELESETFYNWSYDADGWAGEVRWMYNNNTDLPLLWQLNTYSWDQGKWNNSYQSDFLTENMYATSAVQYWEFLETYMPVYGFDGVVSDHIENKKMIDGAWETNGFTACYFSDETVVGVWDNTTVDISIYPNPVIDQLNVKTNSLQETQFVLYDLNGRIIERNNFTGNTIVNVSFLQAGLYFLELREQGQVIFKNKIVKY